MRYIVAISLFFYMGLSYAGGIRVATAANFYPVLNKIKKLFEEETSHSVTIIRGSTGKLYAQIIHGAPFDVFLSADSARAEKLVKLGKSLDGKSYVFAVGQLALWQPDAINSQVIREKLFSGDFNKLAIANPKTAPYGTASIEALKTLEIYEDVKNKLVFGENISQTLQFVDSGAADIGFVARAYVYDSMHWEVDTYLHKPIKQKMILLKQTKNPQIAEAFMRYMQSDEIKKLIEANGYAVLKKNN